MRVVYGRGMRGFAERVARYLGIELVEEGDVDCVVVVTRFTAVSVCDSGDLVRASRVVWLERSGVERGE